MEREWTDFTTCSQVRRDRCRLVLAPYLHGPILLLSLQVNALLNQEYVHISLYALSAVFLLPALAIFFSYKYVAHSYYEQQILLNVSKDAFLAPKINIFFKYS